MAPLFSSVLVANRGEIAVRVIRTLRRLGIRAVAAYSDADAGALHVTLADEAVRSGPAAAAASYLSIPALLDAARRTGAEAIHPGYGFLSESPELARACADAGIVFIGPGSEAMTVMADKIVAKQTVAARGVPVVPGSEGQRLTDDELVAAAATVGYPLLVKPAAGGGGTGMQVVAEESELAGALASARRVAASAFGDDDLLLERFVETPRHIELQVMADRHGGVIHLGERECSLQRRHQKVIEEAPSELLTPAQRERMGAAACEVARSVGYEGAGTVEFLVSDRDPDTFFFIEMNTRLQVEHPVTEQVTGLDLVELQLRIAAGEPLPLRQEDVTLTGHAIEARIYAEAPARGFLPATGAVLDLDEPTGSGRRWDSGLTPGLVVSGDYDPMLAKAIATGADRAEALDRLDAMLAEAVILGVDTNVDFLRSLLALSDMQEGRLDVGLIDRLPPRDPAVPSDADLAAVADLLHFGPRAVGPWGLDGWRAGRDQAPSTGALRALGGHAYAFTHDGVTETVRMVPDPDGSTVWLHRASRTLAIDAPDRATRLARRLAAAERAAGPVSPEVRAAMPGTVVQVAVRDGDVVAAGDLLATVEAMKMEHPLTAPLAGTVRIALQPGHLVRRDQVVATIDPDPDPQEDA
ncbi:acetyl/propionyl/methylcrotonyl-CoA carboxylase subunit alpha [Pseudolysinimonas sp.]|uniref:acetyl/propionyl/methylcrotonyl-CoA carboxylase subunit alpha n=1 Tax=Pseudolysinimonas sp. TaxID=2680009 RepID=UPI003F7F4EA0